MYKCTECNTEFDIKPDYCDCGNDTFEEQITITPVPAKTDIKDILSISIFILCLFLSLLVWLFLGNTNLQKQENAVPKASKPVKTTVSMSDINTLWDDTLPSYVQEQPATVKKNIEEEITTPVQKPKQIPQTVVRKNNATPKPQAQVQKLKTNVQPKAVPKESKTNNQELARYKTALRQAMFSNLAITSIHGKGKCSIEFSIAQNGKLVGRKFISQSSNTTVNDAVYEMLMTIPQYYPPPDSYNGEKIRMSFYFNDGYYEINYLN